MKKCKDCVYGNRFGSYVCAGCVGNSNFKPSHSKIYYESSRDMNALPAAYLAMRRYARTSNDCIFVPEICDVIFSPPATIVFWADGTKTVVKAIHDEFDPEKGLAMAIAKKALGNKGNYFNHIKFWADGYLEKEDE